MFRSDPTEWTDSTLPTTRAGTGVLQHLSGFSLDPASPNALAGRKRPFHTIIPAFMQRGDEHIGFGIMGGLNQPLAHAQFVSNVVDYHMNIIQAAMEGPRFTDRQQSAAKS
jgi:gamma-glutamyltranspeptidase / glutathione hydrolase